MDFGEDGVTISHLSAQLIAHGLLNRPLDFEQLFLAPPSAPASILSSSSDTDKDRRTYERALRHYSRQHAGAVSHALRALWETLSQYSAQHDSLERVSARVRTLEFELKRQREIAKVEKDRADRLNKEKEAEKAATKKAEMERDAERDRLKLTRDELGRAKQSLQFVKSQTQVRCRVTLLLHLLTDKILEETARAEEERHRARSCHRAFPAPLVRRPRPPPRDRAQL